MARRPCFALDDIVHLKIGGIRFSTSKDKLMWVLDSFFTTGSSKRDATHKNKDEVSLIDTDPILFSIILNYLETKGIDLKSVNLPNLQKEVDYYGLVPLIKRLMLREDFTQSSSEDVMFYGCMRPPSIPSLDSATTTTTTTATTPKADAQSPSSEQLRQTIIKIINYIIIQERISKTNANIAKLTNVLNS